jgi:hypothetical protein
VSVCAHLGRGVEGIRGGRQTYLEGELHGCDWTALALRQYRLDGFVCNWRCLFPRIECWRICVGVGLVLRRLEVVLRWRRKAELEWNKVTEAGPCPLTTRKKARHQGPRILQPPPLISQPINVFLCTCILLFSAMPAASSSSPHIILKAFYRVIRLGRFGISQSGVCSQPCEHPMPMHDMRTALYGHRSRPLMRF